MANRKPYHRTVRRDNPAIAKPASAYRLYNAHTGALIEPGAVVPYRGALARVLLVLPNRSRALVVPIDVEDEESPHNRKEARAEDIGAEWR